MHSWRRIRELVRQNAEMRRVLNWYAVSENWRRHSTHPKGAPRVSWEMAPAHQDRGARARGVLIGQQQPSRIRAFVIRFFHRGRSSSTTPEQYAIPLKQPRTVTVPQALARKPDAEKEMSNG